MTSRTGDGKMNVSGLWPIRGEWRGGKFYDHRPRANERRRKRFGKGGNSVGVFGMLWSGINAAVLILRLVLLILLCRLSVLGIRFLKKKLEE